MKQFSILSFFLLLLAACENTAPQAPPTPVVKVVAVREQPVAIEKDFVGQVYGQMDIPIRARVEGFLEGIHFKEGQAVERNQLLYTIDDQPFDAAVQAARSQLAEAEIALVRATNDYNRIAPLAKINAVSERDLDAAVAAKDAAEQMVKAAEAKLRIQNIQKSYAQIKAPISGLIGKTQAKVGEFVGRSPNPVILNTVSLIDSVRVEFFINEKDYLYLAKAWQKTEEKSDIRSRAQALKLILATGEEFEHYGRVDFINRQVDAATGAILVQATFPNPEGLIRPGQFARVRVTTQKVEEGLLIPQRCVSEFQGRFSVMRISDSSTIEQSPVEIIAPYRDYYLIGKGLKAGDVVVIEGLQKAKNGTAVKAEMTDYQSRYQPQQTL